MLLRFAVLVGGTQKARIIAILLVLHFGLAALNHFIEIGEIERDRQSLEAQFPDLGVACYDYIPWLIALSVTIFFAIGETFGGPGLAQGVGRTTRRKLPDVGGHRHGARVRPTAPQPRVLQVLPVPRRRRDHGCPGRPTR